MNKTCPTCDKTFYVSPSRGHIKNCSYACNKVWRKNESVKLREQMIDCVCGCGTKIPFIGTATHKRKFVIGHKSFLRRKPTVIKTNHQIGANYWNWKGGVHKRDKTERVRFVKYYAPKVLNRDNYTCQMCQQYGGYLHVDHIEAWAEFPDLRFDLNNCRTLCRSCHYYITFKRKMPSSSKWGLTSMTGKRG